MRCDRFMNLLHTWMDGTLPSDGAKQMLMHVEACPACAELAQALREALEGCNSLGDEVVVPEATAAAWRNAVRTEAAGGKPMYRLTTRRWETWAGLAAGILVLIGGANLVRLGRSVLQQGEMPVSAVHMEIPLESRMKALSDPQEPSDYLLPVPFAGSGNDDEEPESMYEEADVSVPESEFLASSEPAGEIGGGMHNDAVNAYDGTELLKPELKSAVYAESAEENDSDINKGALAETVSRPTAEFLLDMGIFAVVCLLPAGIAGWFFRLRRRKKKRGHDWSESNFF